MNNAHEHNSPETGEAQGRARAGFVDLQMPGDPEQMDWQALRSRLFTSREKEPALPVSAASPRRLYRRGSFHGCAASALTVYQESSRFVNPDGSSNGKPAGANVSAVAEFDVSGGRGQE
ncbi:hypothetical protein GR702_01845 [Novosphingobium sp. FGD1]|uniref:Uncharacterized protein n=1 Tax=Novosphingobium silvae TaxID=2692619 RepID=A0A7X4K634_9SPHN|nr:hypothetical protein [Novosphingobium silvae]MYL96517.1 hypothetical protein [Novosphingobium silvae]